MNGILTVSALLERSTGYGGKIISMIEVVLMEGVDMSGGLGY